MIQLTVNKNRKYVKDYLKLTKKGLSMTKYMNSIYHYVIKLRIIYLLLKHIPIYFYLTGRLNCLQLKNWKLYLIVSNY